MRHHTPTSSLRQLPRSRSLFTVCSLLSVILIVQALVPSAVEAAADDYTFTKSTGASIVPGTTDIGNHCDDCTTPVALPFQYTFYGQAFNGVNVSSNGNLQFVSDSNRYTNTCLPYLYMDYAIFAYWDDLRTDNTGFGVFTSVSGSAPNRIFNIEWRARYFRDPSSSANFEVRLYEGQERFDIIYGTVVHAGSRATIGVQEASGSASTKYSCEVGGISSGLQLSAVRAPDDSNAPVISGMPNNITQLVDGATGEAAVTYTTPTALDDIDGAVPVTCTPAPGSAFPLGTTTVTCTATDSANNKASATFVVQVIYDFTGFLRPIDNLPTVNAGKAGQGIPVKFSLSGNQGQSIFTTGYPASKQISCETGDPLDTLEETVTAGQSSLQYDATTDKYTYVWKTDKAWANTCRGLVVMLKDGTEHTAEFKFTK